MSTALKGDGKTRTQVRVHKTCDQCGEPAKYRHTYLLAGTRSNPASSAYGRDDCSWCSDADAFFCSEHSGKGQWEVPEGYVSCSHIEASDRYAHMFLTWETVKVAEVTT